ncbi:hypothetical protein [Paenibacillus mendelii]|uniref:Uncharacterized protein n=1 Tax=Paenibacillus mendelii TaxID=206163 RepID=A0ABV6J8S2_9BACL|nr:hypothetical protein [Paenibacillus mendelii]MCQ6560036.1 hypothetical protein [Paenibacillus mendelii]
MEKQTDRMNDSSKSHRPFKREAVLALLWRFPNGEGRGAAATIQ